MYSRSAVGVSRSAMPVNPRTSANSTVSSRVAPSMVYWPGLSAMSATSSGATYCEKRETSAWLLRTSKK